jgi:MFS family permease
MRPVLAWAPVGLSIALAVGTLVFGAIDGRWDDAAVLIPAIAFAAVGSLIASRQPGNPIGWLFCAVGVVLAGVVFATAYAYHALIAEPGSLPGGAYAAFVGANIWAVAFYAGVFILLLFPTGEPPSQRWRSVLWLQALGLFLYVVGLFGPETLTEPFEGFDNPLHIEGTPGALENVSVAGWFILVAGYVLAAVAVSLRFRRSGAVERQQLKWMASAGVVYAAAFAVQGFASDAGSELLEEVVNVVALVALTSIPLAAGFAILRYRLYEIDVIVRRTLVYGVATAALAGLYFGIVLALQQVFSGFAGGSDLAVAISTLAVAALFGPARRRVQKAVDRRFYRRRYDAQRTLESFSATLRDEVDLDALGGELRGVVRETMQPAHVSLWLRRTGGAR